MDLFWRQAPYSGSLPHRYHRHDPFRLEEMGDRQPYCEIVLLTPCQI